ncbi:MAG: GIY-YIG nuclease family protein [Vicinamibacterales bacterium]
MTPMAIDRKALIRQYKDTPRTAGVGIVRNLANGKSLIVAGRDLPALLNRHKAQLRLDAHPVPAMQEDFNRQPIDTFVFETLDTLPPPETPGYDPSDDLRVLEALWLAKLAPYEPAGYHRPPKA